MAVPRLKECAQCGKDGYVEVDARAWGFMARCLRCGRRTAIYPTQRRAYNAWNRKEK
jgi:hypothetical protein